MEDNARQFMEDLLSHVRETNARLDGQNEFNDEITTTLEGVAEVLEWFQRRLTALEGNMPTPEPEPIQPYMWLSPDEINTLNDGSEAWARLVGWAYRNDAPVLCDQDNNGDTIAVAAAVMAVRYGDQDMRMKVERYIETITGQEQAAGCAEGGKLLALGRNLAGYVVAAQLIGYRRVVFSEWLRMVIDKMLWERPAPLTLREAAIGEQALPNNHGTAYRMSLLAVAHYLNDMELMNECADKFGDWLGSESFEWKWDPQTREQQWHASYPDVTRYKAINPVGSVIDIGGTLYSTDGALPEEMKRPNDGDPVYPFPRENYVVEALSYALVEAHMLSRMGYDVWNWEDKALLRAFQFLHAPNFPSHSDRVDTEWEFAYLPQDQGDPELNWIINAVYGTEYPTEMGGPGKSGLGWWPIIYP